MIDIRTSIEINASAEKVWKILTDFQAYPEWNPVIQRVEGELKLGAVLEVYAKPPGATGSAFKPKVLCVDPYRHFRWLGRWIAPRVLDGEHMFTLEPLSPDRVRFVNDEEFSGLVTPFYKYLRLDNSRRGFEQMNLALKRQAEQTR